MEEKERYEIHIYDDICVDLYDNGVLDKSINDTYKLEELLNQQSKRLKELEQENQQLKQSQNQVAISKLERLHDMFCSTINNRNLQNYVCSIIRFEIEELKNDGKL